MAKKVLLLGGTGAIGTYLAPELVNNGYVVHITTRSEIKSNDKNIKYIKGDAHDIGFLYEVISKKYDTIVDFMSYATSEFKSRYKSLLKSTNQYIFLSSYRVFADDKIITEKSPRLLDISTDEAFLKTEEYSLAKARQEDILRSAKTNNWTIVRPAITYSKERFQLGTLEADVWLWRALQGKTNILPEEMMERVTTMTWAGDVAWMISGLVENKKALGEDYNISTTEHQTWADVVKIYQKSVNLKIKLVSTDKFLSVIGGEYQLKYDRLYNRRLDNRKVIKVVGNRKFMPLYFGLQKELREFTKNPKFTNVDAEIHRQIDNLTPSRAKILLQNAKRRTRVRTRARQSVAKFRKYIDNREYTKADGAILTLTGYFNYGNVLQRYALQEFLRRNGHDFVSYVDSHSVPRDLYRVGRKRRAKTPLRALMRLARNQKPYWYIPKYGEIYPEARGWENIITFVNKHIWVKPFDPGDKYRNYIVGSDQVWRNWWGNSEILGYYFFNFLKSRKVNRVAYAASFGKDSISEVMSTDDIKYVKQYIEKMNGVSVREKSGVSMIKRTWGIKDVEVVVDPTLLLEAPDYSKIIDDSDVKHVEIQPIFTYILGENPEIKDFISRVKEVRHQSATSIRAHGGSENDVLPPVEMWLKGFRDAELAVTNSFHGMMFAIVNNTDFIVIGRDAGGLPRIKDFLGEYGLSNRYVDEDKLSLFNLKKLKPIDWASVNRRLSKNRKQSGDWLLAGLRK